MTIRTPYWLQNGTYTGDDDRLTLQTLLGGSPNQSVVSGVIGPTDFKVTQTGTPSMLLNVNSGAAWVDGQNSATEGVYASLVDDTTQQVTITTANGTNPRIDLVVLQVRNSEYSGAHDDAILTVVKGTAAASPVAPALSANQFLLAQILVGTSVTSITTANITDKRVLFAPLNLLRGIPSGRLTPTAQTIIATGSTGAAITSLVASSLRGGMTNGTSNALTAPVPGLYEATCFTIWQNSGGAVPAGLYVVNVVKNGALGDQIGTQQITGTAYAVCSGSTELELVAGDNVSFWGQQNSGGSQGIFGDATHTRFGLKLIAS